VADLAADINAPSRISARGASTVLERLLEEISFSASDKRGESVTVDAAMVKDRVASLAASADLSRYIL
jgi:ATP-dependent HslUV protease ATP-binding subunit HslU